jgi:protein ImuA
VSRADPKLSFEPAAPEAPTLREVFAATSTDGAATGFVLAQLSPNRPVLWLQDRLSRREGGVPYVSGQAFLLGRPVEFLLLQLARPVDVLRAMEEALGCPALGGVVGEVWGDPPALDFTATKRLTLRAERGGVPAWLLRRAATADLSAARERWRVAALASPPEPFDLRAPGEAIWQATLFRARGALPSDWLARPDRSGRLLLEQSAPPAAPRRAVG